MSSENRYKKLSVSFSKFPNQNTNTFSGPFPTLEFHVSRNARDKYQFDLSMFTITGNVIFANMHAARLFAQKMNEKRDLIIHPEKAISAAELNAMGLIDEIIHALITHYRLQINPQVHKEALDRLEKKFSKAEVDKTLHTFINEFPPIEVYLKKVDIDSYLNGITEGVSNREIVLEEMLLLWLANNNPAFSRYDELFDDESLEHETIYLPLLEELNEFFDDQPHLDLGYGALNLIRLLRSPSESSPDSLKDQLLYIKEKWGAYLKANLKTMWELFLSESFMELWGDLSTDYEMRLLRTLDFITEEQKMRFNPALGAAPTHALEFGGADAEPERFSPDVHWMPSLVLLAKSTLVWLDQLSKKYQRHIYRLDQIPDEELDTLARWGFSGLWLIGIWQRSHASKEIKRRCGNPEAESSAYSLFDYRVANELGGHSAYENLRDRCWQRGIRLASDMVPNHTGIDSKWIREHPDWFIQLPYSPFPSYTFNSGDLCGDPNIEIIIEDHYYERSDAAVVFKRVDKNRGDVRYIYHGNDGTSMPWNDTAQLDFTKPEVREAVIQAILHVARNFSVIRFDAAMTLAKRHYQRLWFPEPGSGGDIPSRAEHGMTRAQFNELMPVEFWREVVDRVAQEAPDTLLLAEAFWMMEGYFVRTLGMHRVYNSAFMNMLKNEENQKYRYTIKNTIEFDPEVLKRYVNFMNNPDEETAIAQFGDGDKYFGVCMMMVTMPGLPMFGHGQIEGFREKYGMEYTRGYMDEQPNQYLIERHEREIFALLTKRYLFAGVENFRLYDFFTPDGSVNENVFAYSNRFQEERALVVFHNTFQHTTGWINTSAAYAEKLDGSGNETEKRLVQKNLGEGLNLPNDDNYFCIFRDFISGLEYIRNCRSIWDQGMFIELNAFKYQVFVDFRIVQDDEVRLYNRLSTQLNGRGVYNIEEALREVYLQPIHHALWSCMNVDTLNKLMQHRVSKEHPQVDEKVLVEIKHSYFSFLNTAKNFEKTTDEVEPIANEVFQELKVALAFKPEIIRAKYGSSTSRKFKSAIKYLDDRFLENSFTQGILFCWIFFRRLGKLFNKEGFITSGRSLIDEWMLHKIIEANFRQLGMSEDQSSHSLSIIKLLVSHQNWADENGPKKGRERRLLTRRLNDPEFQSYLGVNRYDGILWYNKEAFETIVKWLFTIDTFDILVEAEAEQSGTRIEPANKAGSAKAMGSKSGTDFLNSAERVAKRIAETYKIVEQWLKAKEGSEYQVAKLLGALEAPASGKQRTRKTKKKSSS